MNEISAPLIVMALREESRGMLEASGAKVLYSGVGKVNAALTLARALTEIRASGAALPRVINMGTAGSRSVQTHSLVACNRFAQRDMDVSGLGFAAGVTPFDDAPAVLQFAPFFVHLPQLLCSTADSFATDLHAVSGDVVDMEAFALARVCLACGADFACVKYITDGADGDSATHWQAALEAASLAFAAIYQNISRNQA